MKNQNTKHFYSKVCIAFFAIFFMAALTACARRETPEGTEGTLAEVETLASGNLAKIGRKGPRTIFISIHDPAGKLLALSSDARGALAAKGFSLVDSPSRAAWIMQVSVLGESAASLDSLRENVNEGYGKPLKFAGHGINAVVADVLLVKRRVPTSHRPSQERLKNIGQKNALDSSQMRLGLYVPHETPGHVNLPDYFSRALCRDLVAALNGAAPG